jgi:hypothetical protein
MARIELTIDAENLPDWGIWEGVREFAQNSLDGHDRGFQMEVDFGHNKLFFVNKGVVLSRDVLLVGNSNKRGDDNQRGEWGEGLDCGILALVRAGRKVTIRNGNETWRPVIEQSRQFDSKVLVVYTRRANSKYAPNNEYVAELEITHEEWMQFKGRFVAFSKTVNGVDAVLDGSKVGRLLTDPEHQGAIYCRGIWVQTREDLCYGYDLSNVQLDRDRKMPSEHSLRWALSQAWMGLIMNEPGYAMAAYKILSEDEHTDLQELHGHLQYWNHGDGARVPEKMAEVFSETHGERCLPVAEQGHSLQLSHYGRIGVIVPRRLSKVLSRHYGEFDSILSDVSQLHFNKVEKRDLVPEEERVYWRSLMIFCECCRTYRVEVLERMALQVSIVEFTDEGTVAAWEPTKCAIYISRKMLSSEGEFLGSLVHEKAHDYTLSHDGTVLQTSVERQLWRELMSEIMRVVPPSWPHMCSQLEEGALLQ